jgi:hypothetical protein
MDNVDLQKNLSACLPFLYKLCTVESLVPLIKLIVLSEKLLEVLATPDVA